MDINKKVLIFIFFSCLAFMAYIIAFKMKTDVGIRVKDFIIEDIKSIAVTKYPDKIEFLFTDSSKISQIRNELLRSKSVDIQNTRLGHFNYDLKFHYANGDSAIMYSKKNPKEGIWFKYLATFYSNDSLFIVLDSLTK